MTKSKDFAEDVQQKRTQHKKHAHRAIITATQAFALSTRLGSILFLKMATIMGDKINDLV